MNKAFRNWSYHEHQKCVYCTMNTESLAILLILLFFVVVVVVVIKVYLPGAYGTGKKIPVLATVIPYVLVI